MRLLNPAGAALLLLLSSVPALGQNVSLDEGAFRLLVNGEEVGREEFSIRRTGIGDQARVILQGTVEMEVQTGQLTLAPAMEAGGENLGVSAYQIKVSGAETTDIYVILSGSRYQSRVISSAGEQLREFRAGPGSVLLDQDVAHQNYLLSPFLEAASSVSLTVLTPRAGRQTRMTLTFVGEEEIPVGRAQVLGRRFHVEGGQETRDVWFDEQGRILRVEVPSLGYVAERENLS